MNLNKVRNIRGEIENLEKSYIKGQTGEKTAITSNSAYEKFYFPWSNGGESVPWGTTNQHNLIEKSGNVWLTHKNWLNFYQSVLWAENERYATRCQVSWWAISYVVSRRDESNYMLESHNLDVLTSGTLAIFDLKNIFLDFYISKHIIVASIQTTIFTFTSRACKV